MGWLQQVVQEMGLVGIWLYPSLGGIVSVSAWHDFWGLTYYWNYNWSTSIFGINVFPPCFMAIIYILLIVDRFVLVSFGASIPPKIAAAEKPRISLRGLWRRLLWKPLVAGGCGSESDVIRFWKHHMSYTIIYPLAIKHGCGKSTMCRWFAS